MDGTNKPKVSPSSLISDLFGANKSHSSSSSDYFASIFSRSLKAGDEDSTSCYDASGFQKQISDARTWEHKQTTDNMATEDEQGHISIFQEHNHHVVEACQLSSSLYYGGQDLYSSATSGSSLNSMYKKDAEDDRNGNHSEGVCRGNWWQGSLYY